jgi:hypothetical protein
MTAKRDKIVYEVFHERLHRLLINGAAGEFVPIQRPCFSLDGWYFAVARTTSEVPLPLGVYRIYYQVKQYETVITGPKLIKGRKK